MDFQAVRAELMRMGDLACGLAVVGAALRLPAFRCGQLDTHLAVFSAPALRFAHDTRGVAVRQHCKRHCKLILASSPLNYHFKGALLISGKSHR